MPQYRRHGYDYTVLYDENPDPSQWDEVTDAPDAPAEPVADPIVPDPESQDA